MKGTIENPVVIAVIEHEAEYMSNYEVLDWGSDEWLDVQYKHSCFQFEKSEDLEVIKQRALEAFGTNNTDYTIRAI